MRASRFDTVKQNRLCFNCLYPQHRVAECTSTGTCRANNCGKRHHTTLHRLPDSCPNARVATVNHALNSVNSEVSQVCFQVLPVVVTGHNGRHIVTHALLDSASDVTLIDESLALDLGLKGVRRNLTVSTMNSVVTVPSSRVSFGVRAADDPGAPVVGVLDAWTKVGPFNCAGQRTSSLTKISLT